jgi:phosphatidylserine decarboxylase
LAGEKPVVMLRLQVLGCKDLLAKDRNGFSDPYDLLSFSKHTHHNECRFVVVSILNKRFRTPAIKRTTQPIYTKDATFDFPLYMSLADKLGVVEIVVWDKDMLKKDYLGEVALPLEDWFVDRSKGDKDRPFAFEDPGNQVGFESFVGDS